MTNEAHLPKDTISSNIFMNAGQEFFIFIMASCTILNKKSLPNQVIFVGRQFLSYRSLFQFLLGNFLVCLVCNHNGVDHLSEAKKRRQPIATATCFPLQFILFTNMLLTTHNRKSKIDPFCYSIHFEPRIPCN